MKSASRQADFARRREYRPDESGVHVSDSKKADDIRDVMEWNGLEDISSVSEK
jgi:hypothetical protein